MDGFRARAPRRVDDARDIEIAGHLLDLAGAPGVECARVVGGGHGDRSYPETVAGGEDPRGDLPAVGYEELSDLHAGVRFSRNARSPSWPSALVRRAAAISAAARPSGRLRTSFFAARTASGPPARRCETTASTRSSRPPSATSLTSPIRSATSAPKRSPVR